MGWGVKSCGEWSVGAVGLGSTRAATWRTGVAGVWTPRARRRWERNNYWAIRVFKIKAAINLVHDGVCGVESVWDIAHPESSLQAFTNRGSLFNIAQSYH